MTPGFFSLVAVSFFGAANDNILKQIITLMVVVGGLWANILGEGTQGAVFLVLSVPFIFLSGFAGQIADKYSKRDVILWVKILEVPIAIIALIGLWLGSFWISLFALLLLAVQSSFYGPAKFGVIPEVVGERHLSQANGLLVGMSNLAVIVGSLAAGPLADWYYPTLPATEVQVSIEDSEAPLAAATSAVGEPQTAAENSLDDPVLVRDPNQPAWRLPAGLALVAVALGGLATVFLMPKSKPLNPGLQISYRLLKPHIETFRLASRPLVVVLCSWSGFFLIGSMALLLLPDYRSILVVSNTKITILTGLLAISVVVGSVTVGLLSGKTIRPYLSLLGAGCMTACFVAMGLAPMSYTLLAVLIFLIGFFAGFYIVPLQSLLQYLSPQSERGRFFGTANTMSFIFISAAAAIYQGLRLSGMPPERIPLVCAAFALVGTTVGAIELHRIMSARDQRHVGFEE